MNHAMAKNLRQQWNDTCKAAGLKPISRYTAAQLLAVVYKYDREDITHNAKLLADVAYIQHEYGIEGGATPDKGFCELFARYVIEIEENGDKPTEWAQQLMREIYNITL